MTAHQDRHKLPLIGGVISALLGGLLLDVAAPGAAWWPAAFIGTSLVFAALWRQTFLTGLLLGAAAGVAFWLPLIEWLTLYLGPIPWLALSAMMVLWFSLFGGLIAVVTRRLDQLIAHQKWKIAAQSFTVAALWATRETVQGAWPYDGFAWGRLAHTQSVGPLVDTVSWLGFTGLSALIALISAVPIAVVFASLGRPIRSAVISGGASVVACALVVAVLSLLPPSSASESGTLRVLAVQGNSKSGVFDDRESGDVIAAHLEATEKWLDEGGEAVDVIVWPENSAEFNIPHNSSNLRRINTLATRADAPIVVGTIIREELADQPVYTNSSLVIEPGGRVDQRFDKRHPVPFAEYMPHRSFYRALVPDLVDLVQLEYQAGTTPAAVLVDSVSAGIAICFDIIFDDMSKEMVGAGAEVIFAQTNNADFGRTDQSEQQLEIARLRAVEMGRSLVNISTVATSEVIDRDGNTVVSIPQWTSGTMEATVTLYRGETFAIRNGSLISALLNAIALLGVGGVFVAPRLIVRLTPARSQVL